MIYALHGFLGKPSDWDFLDLKNIHAPNLHQASPTKDFWTWAEDFNREVATQDKNPVLLGYSMGGRLALHTLLQAPKLWKAAIIISAHSGLAQELERAARQKSDALLAHAFLQQTWASVTDKWHGRPMFGGLPPPSPRQESEYSREALAFALTTWSLGRQDFLLPRLKEITCPVLWMAGEKEEKFVEQAQLACQHLPKAKCWIAKDCYHRVPWEKPQEFLAKTKEFLCQNNGFQ